MSESIPKQGHRARGMSAALFAIAMLALATLVTASAQGGSGGVGGDGGETESQRSGSKYAQQWDELKKKHKRWARRTSECESGGNARIHSPGGTYHGAFQFLKSTWKSSPKSPGGDPHRFTWKTQAVVAVALMKRDGKGHWPNCGQH